MKHILLLSTIALTVLSGCSTAFKSGQTPDDVYYSPAREVSPAKEDELTKQQQEEYQEYISSQDDRYLRMKVAHRNRWSSIDDYDYWYDSRYDFGCSNTYNHYSYSNPWNPSWGISIGSGYGRRGYGSYGWNNPLYTVVYYGSPKFSGGGSTSGSNISAFRNKNYSNENYGFKDPKTGAFIPNNGNSNFGNLLKRVFSSSTSGSNGNTTSYDRPARTFNNSTPSNTNSTPPPAPSSNAGGNSGGVKSTGSSTSTGRGGRG
jgi:hypothetical protein